MVREMRNVWPPPHFTRLPGKVPWSVPNEELQHRFIGWRCQHVCQLGEQHGDGFVEKDEPPWELSNKWNQVLSQCLPLKLQVWNLGIFSCHSVNADSTTLRPSASICGPLQQNQSRLPFRVGTLKCCLVGLHASQRCPWVSKCLCAWPWRYRPCLHGACSLMGSTVPRQIITCVRWVLNKDSQSEKWDPIEEKRSGVWATFLQI